MDGTIVIGIEIASCSHIDTIRTAFKEPNSRPFVDSFYPPTITRHRWSRITETRASRKEEKNKRSISSTGIDAYMTIR